ncbi:MAG: response regulator transcription factor [Magnetovibrio sp.]|nr:response regulator transcription factor [Magnetovibrio sp.]
MVEVSSIPVYLVDDDDAVRGAIRYMLEGYDFYIQDFESGERFLNEAPLDEPGCLILDHRMPGINGQQVHERLNALKSCLKVIFLTSHADLPMAVKAFRDGACDFHQKPVNAADLVPSIEKAQNKSRLHHTRNRLRERFKTMTEREAKVFKAVIQGQMNKQIAHELCLSTRTVEVHRAKMMERLGAKSMTDLANIAEALKD